MTISKHSIPSRGCNDDTEHRPSLQHAPARALNYLYGHFLSGASESPSIHSSNCFTPSGL